MKHLKLLFALSCFFLATNAFAQVTAEKLVQAGAVPGPLTDILATLGTGSLGLANNTYATARNAANSANISVWKVDATDDTVVNADSGDLLKLAIAGTTELTLGDDSLTASGAAFQIIPGATSFAIRNNANSASNLSIVDAGTVSMLGPLSLTTAASKILPGATSLTIRNNADSADNLGIVDAGTVSMRGPLSLTTAASKIIPGATSFTVRNNADSADNLAITNAGLVTVGQGNVALTAGNLTFGAAAAKIIPGATSLSIRNNADSATNLSIVDAGGALARGPLNVAAAALDADVTGAFGVPQFSLVVDNSGADGTVLVGTGANTSGSHIYGAKTRSTSSDANVIVASGDQLAVFGAYGADGASYRPAAAIVMTSDATPGASDMPGAIDLQTSPDGSATLASVLKLSNTKAAVFTGTVTSSATGTAGWSVVAGANTACTTTCTSACAFGVNTAATEADIVDCADATADKCLCLGAS